MMFFLGIGGGGMWGRVVRFDIENLLVCVECLRFLCCVIK